MIPKINFRYSQVYDHHWKESSKNKKNYPSKQRILGFIKKISRLWKKEEQKILREISKISGLKWQSKNIDCYVVGRCVPFSDPLTVPIIERYPDYFIDTLIHELIHVIFIQGENLKKARKSWVYFNRKYKKEKWNTRIHIPLHAIHKHIYMKFFNEQRLQRDINLISKLPDYRKSWGVVQNSDYKKIIRNFRERIK